MSSRTVGLTEARLALANSEGKTGHGRNPSRRPSCVVQHDDRKFSRRPSMASDASGASAASSVSLTMVDNSHQTHIGSTPDGEELVLERHNWMGVAKAQSAGVLTYLRLEDMPEEDAESATLEGRMGVSQGARSLIRSLMRSINDADDDDASEEGLGAGGSGLDAVLAYACGHRLESTNCTEYCPRCVADLVTSEALQRLIVEREGFRVCPEAILQWYEQLFLIQQNEVADGEFRGRHEWIGDEGVRREAVERSSNFQVSEFGARSALESAEEENRRKIVCAIEANKASVVTIQAPKSGSDDTANVHPSRNLDAHANNGTGDVAAPKPAKVDGGCCVVM